MTPSKPLFDEKAIKRLEDSARHAKLAQEYATKANYHAQLSIQILNGTPPASVKITHNYDDAQALNAMKATIADLSSGKGKVKFLPTMQKNCDLAYQIFVEEGKPLSKGELLAKMRATGKTALTKASSLAFYIRQDSRFEKAGHGLWRIRRDAALSPQEAA